VSYVQVFLLTVKSFKKSVIRNVDEKVLAAKGLKNYKLVSVLKDLKIELVIVPRVSVASLCCLCARRLHNCCVLFLC
jgi:hypothetical protein